mmetsp:Transcript_7919/g.34981  ORF Transcript_7919/g.34981 Transcript_7919/m.34981 type:complete len:282 (+) Transcript_7919:217-1062(+)
MLGQNRALLQYTPSFVTGPDDAIRSIPRLSSARHFTSASTASRIVSLFMLLGAAMTSRLFAIPSLVATLPLSTSQFSFLSAEVMALRSPFLSVASMLMTTHWPVLVSDVSTTVAVTLASTLESSGGMYWGFLATAPSDHELSAASTTTARTLAIMVPHNSPSSSKNESPSPNVTGHSSGSLTTNLLDPFPSTVVISAPTTWRLLSLSAAQTSFSRPGRSGALTITSAVHLSFTSTWMSACSPPRSSVRISSASSQEISPPRATTRPRCAGPLATLCDGKGT